MEESSIFRTADSSGSRERTASRGPGVVDTVTSVTEDGGGDRSRSGDNGGPVGPRLRVVPVPLVHGQGGIRRDDPGHRGLLPVGW